MLLYRWEILAQWAALQEIYEHTAEFHELVPAPTDAIKAKPLVQLEIIKELIIQIVPEAKFIRPKFEFSSDFPVEDFVELYMKHQHISITKTIEKIKELKIK